MPTQEKEKQLYILINQLKGQFRLKLTEVFQNCRSETRSIRINRGQFETEFDRINWLISE